MASDAPPIQPPLKGQYAPSDPGAVPMICDGLGEAKPPHPIAAGKRWYTRLWRGTSNTGVFCINCYQNDRHPKWTALQNQKREAVENSTAQSSGAEPGKSAAIAPANPTTVSFQGQSSSTESATIKGRQHSQMAGFGVIDFGEALDLPRVQAKASDLPGKDYKQPALTRAAMNPPALKTTIGGGIRVPENPFPRFRSREASLSQSGIATGDAPHNRQIAGAGNRELGMSHQLPPIPANYHDLPGEDYEQMTVRKAATDSPASTGTVGAGASSSRNFFGGVLKRSQTPAIKGATANDPAASADSINSRPLTLNPTRRTHESQNSQQTFHKRKADEVSASSIVGNDPQQARAQPNNRKRARQDYDFNSVASPPPKRKSDRPVFSESVNELDLLEPDDENPASYYFAPGASTFLGLDSWMGGAYRHTYLAKKDRD